MTEQKRRAAIVAAAKVLLTLWDSGRTQDHEAWLRSLDARVSDGIWTDRLADGVQALADLVDTAE